MKLVLLRNHINLQDQEQLGDETCWMYYYYILAEKKIEQEQIEAMKEQSQQGAHLDFPDDFMSQLLHEVTTAEIEREKHHE